MAGLIELEYIQHSGFDLELELELEL